MARVPEMARVRLPWHPALTAVPNVYFARPASLHCEGYVYIPCVPLATEPGWLADRCSVSQQLGALQTHSFSFLTERTYSCSNFVLISSLVLVLKKRRVR